MRSGVVLILLSMSMTPFGDALSKHLGETQSPFFIVFLRYLIAGLIALALAGITRTPVSLPKHGRGGFVLRTGLVVGAMALLILALSLVPLATAVGGFLIAPIVATVISVLFLGEALTLPRLLGGAASFFGALMILRPDGAVEAGILVAVAGGAMLGAFLALSRAAHCSLNAISALAVQCLLGAAMLAPIAMFQADLMVFSLLWPALGLGLVTAATHFLTVAAYQRAEPARLAPFFYFNLVAAVIVGVVWFQEIPGSLTLIGLGLIVSGGLIALMPGIPLRVRFFHPAFLTGRDFLPVRRNFLKNP
jgi:drug/metabolite transporter (DMT)-like permease